MKAVSINISVRQLHFNIEMLCEEKLSEYFNFLRNLPELIPSENQRLINSVKNEWKIYELLTNIEQLNFEKKLINVGDGNFLLDELALKLGKGLNVLCPPVSRCLLCDEKLAINNKPTQIIVHGLRGPVIYSKYILLCKNCWLTTKDKFAAGDQIRQDVTYHPDKVRKHLD